MFQSVQQRSRGSEPATTVDIAPLIDIVFIVLIFFLVTATFVRDTGIEVNRPEASQSLALKSQSLRLSIAPGGGVYYQGNKLTNAQVRQAVEDFTANHDQASVIVIPDRQLPSGRLVEVMDLARQAGANRVAVATRANRGR